MQHRSLAGSSEMVKRATPVWLIKRSPGFAPFLFFKGFLGSFCDPVGHLLAAWLEMLFQPLGSLSSERSLVGSNSPALFPKKKGPAAQLGDPRSIWGFCGNSESPGVFVVRRAHGTKVKKHQKKARKQQDPLTSPVVKRS